MALRCCLRIAQNPSMSLGASTLTHSSLTLINVAPLRQSSTISPIFAEYHRKRKKQWQKPRQEEKDAQTNQAESHSPSGSQLPPNHLLYTIPELVPTTYWGHRDSVRETLERLDLTKRRSAFRIPEFYVGSIMSVTVADDASPTKQTKFVGICIQKCEPGIRHKFTLRNFIDDQGVEVMYELYNPMIRDITVIKLEKRLDDDLTYLRDALPEYSTVPFDLKPIPRGVNEAIPLNETKVKMKPAPWTRKWERKGYKGIDESTIMSQLTEKQRAERLEPFRNEMWQRYDLALQYRNSVTREETDAILDDMAGRFERARDAESLPDEERPIISRKKARKVS